VYLCLKWSDAETIARSAWAGGGGQVIEVEIRTDGHIWNAGFEANPGSTWRWPIGLVKSKHPAWPRAGHRSPFTELAVRNPSRITIL